MFGKLVQLTDRVTQALLGNPTGKPWLVSQTEITVPPERAIASWKRWKLTPRGASFQLANCHEVAHPIRCARSSLSALLIIKVRGR